MTRPAVVRLTGNSSRFDRSPASLLRAVRTYALRSNFIVTTEVSRNERSRILPRVAGWGTVHFEDPALSGEDESAISFRKLGWRKVHATAPLLSSKPIARRNGARNRSVDGLFENRRTKQRVQICAFHLPARDPEQLSVWLDCIDHLMTKWDAWTRDPEIDCVILVGDWNYDVRDPDRRDHMHHTFPGSRLTWSMTRMPTQGTHGRSLIDWAAVYGGIITRAELLADDASSDHRPWWMVVRLP